MGLEVVTIWKNIRGLIILSFVLHIVMSVFTGSVHFVKTGDYQPLLEDTIGKLVASDNLAYQMEKDLESGKLDSIPEEYREFVKESLLNKILSNILAQLAILYVIFRAWKFFFEWNTGYSSTKHTLLEIIASIITYGSLGVGYFVITTIAAGKSLGAAETLLSGIPFKSIVFGIQLALQSI